MKDQHAERGHATNQSQKTRLGLAETLCNKAFAARVCLLCSLNALQSTGLKVLNSIPFNANACFHKTLLAVLHSETFSRPKIWRIGPPGLDPRCLAFSIEMHVQEYGCRETQTVKAACTHTWRQTSMRVSNQPRSPIMPMARIWSEHTTRSGNCLVILGGGGGLDWPPWDFGCHPPIYRGGGGPRAWSTTNIAHRQKDTCKERRPLSCSGSTPMCHNVPQPVNNVGGLPNSATHPPTDLPKRADTPPTRSSFDQPLSNCLDKMPSAKQNRVTVEQGA